MGGRTSDLGSKARAELSFVAPVAPVAPVRGRELEEEPAAKKD